MIKALMLFLLMINNSYAGDERGNGGDYIVQDFVINAQKALKVLKAKHSNFPFLDLNKVENAINDTEVMLLNSGETFPGIVRTAMNYPLKKQIVLNQDRWKLIRMERRKMALSLHEYLGITGYEINNYLITSQIFGLGADEVEKLPSIKDLRNSFKVYEKEYEIQLSISEKLVIPSLIDGKGEELTDEACEELANDFLLVTEARGLILSCWKNLELFKVKGITQLGLEYLFILKNRWRLPRERASDVYIGKNKQIVQVVHRDNYEQRLVTKSSNGNIYAFEDDSYKPYKSSYVFFANGLLGDALEKRFYRNSSRVTRRYSVATNEKWNSLDLRITTESGEVASDTVGGGDQGSSFSNFNYSCYNTCIYRRYNYFDKGFEFPDSYWTYEFQSEQESIVGEKGFVNINRRRYYITK